MTMKDESRFDVTVERAEDFRFSVDFGLEGVETLEVDEPPPLGDGEGPNAARLLAAAVGNCLSASLVYCLSKAEADPDAVRATVTGELSRNHRGRLRIPELRVGLQVSGTEGSEKQMERCLELFEDYCIVTQSVRDGLDVLVEVRTSAGEGAAAGYGAGSGVARTGLEEAAGHVPAGGSGD